MKNPFHWKHYNQLIVVPIVLILLSLFAIFVYPGVTYGLDFKGGTLLTVYTNATGVDTGILKEKLSQFSSSVDVRSFSAPDGGSGLEIELGPSDALENASATSRELDSLKTELDSASLEYTYLQAQVDSGTVTSTDLEKSQATVAGLEAKVVAKSGEVLSALGDNSAVPQKALDAYALAHDTYTDRQDSYQQQVIEQVKSVAPVSSYSAREVGSTLSKQFLSKTIQILVLSFLLTSIVVFVIFRSFIPSFAVVFGAISDIIITLGVMSVLGLPLTLASFAALLMLIAFSFDTDVLLTVRVLKRSDGTAHERAFEAMKMAVMINIATLISYSVLLGASTVLSISTYYQIASVAVIGAIVDFIATWYGNAVLILHFFGKK
jgi:preprotein translocase subunit SecF